LFERGAGPLDRTLRKGSTPARKGAEPCPGKSGGATAYPTDSHRPWDAMDRPNFPPSLRSRVSSLKSSSRILSMRSAFMRPSPAYIAFQYGDIAETQHIGKGGGRSPRLLGARPGQSRMVSDSRAVRCSVLKGPFHGRNGPARCRSVRRRIPRCGPGSSVFPLCDSSFERRNGPPPVSSEAGRPVEMRRRALRGQDVGPARAVTTHTEVSTLVPI
jgi:hypothetical protein